MNTTPRFSMSTAFPTLLSEGKLRVQAHQLALVGLGEQRFRSLFPDAELGHGGEGHTHYWLRSVDIEGELSFAGFYFAHGTFQSASLALARNYGEEWANKIWEESYLEMVTEVHALWLGHLLGRRDPVRNATFEWGDATVSIDKKGWDSGLTLSPRWTQLQERK
jgi:hypothetical protein